MSPLSTIVALFVAAGRIAYAQNDTNPAYVIQDANYNVVGVFNKGNTSGSNLSNLLGEQYTWTPYGEVSAKAVASGLPHSRIGHQGLFWDTLEVRGAEVLKPGDAGIYYNRNRFYSPKLGRFLNRDPNESGAPTLALAMNAQSVDALFGGFALSAQYGDGANLYSFVRNNPISLADPDGLSAWDEDLEEAMDDRRGHALAALGMLNEYAGIASVGLQTSVRLAASLIPGYGIYEASQNIQIIASGRGGFMDYLSVGLTGASHAVYLYKAFKWFRQMKLASVFAKRAAHLTGQIHHAISRKVLTRSRRIQQRKAYTSIAIQDLPHKPKTRPRTMDTRHGTSNSTTTLRSGYKITAQLQHNLRHI